MNMLRKTLINKRIKCDICETEQFSITGVNGSEFLDENVLLSI